MKKHNVFALAVVVVFALAAGVASSGTRIVAGDLMKFPKNATYDSTEVSIAAHAVGNAATAAQDTTGWYQLTRNLSTETGVTGVLMGLQFDHQSSATVTSDSMSYIIQWTSDEATVAGTRSNFTAPATATAFATTGLLSNSTIVTAVVPTDKIANWFRVIVFNSKVTNSNTARKFRVRPIYWQAQ